MSLLIDIWADINDIVLLKNLRLSLDFTDPFHTCSVTGQRYLSIYIRVKYWPNYPFRTNSPSVIYQKYLQIL